jgi:hypothetical protein
LLSIETLQSWHTDPQEIMDKANRSLDAPLVSITDTTAPMSEGGKHDYYSNGDYWWPNPDTPDGLPFVRRDGESYPGAFLAHRKALRSMRTNVANLAAGYAVTGKKPYADKAADLLRTFFLEESTLMKPHLLYAQAIPGVCPGRGIGIIDTLHLIDIPAAAKAIEPSGALTSEEMGRLKKWFADYLDWMCTHPNGVEERDADNNHGVCWAVQAAAFARFTGNEDVLAMCRERYKTVLLPEQMAQDGSFPRESGRTKPYGYSIFVLDNMVTLCQLLSVPSEDLWRFELPDGRGIRLGLDYLYPYLADKSTWPYPPDVEHFEAWPVRMSFMLYAGLALQDERYLKLWSALEPNPTDTEIRRNTALRQPILWLLK